MSAGGFVKVPTALLYDPEMPDGALRAYLALARYAISCSSDTFEMTGEQLGTLLGRTRRPAVRLLDELEARALVVIEGNRGRARPNRITVLDPQGVVFAGLHVTRAVLETTQEAVSKTAQPAVSKTAQPSIEGIEDERGQRTERTTPLPRPVDNGGAARPPRRERCATHEPPGSWSDAAECRGCLADAKAGGWSRSPRF